MRVSLPENMKISSIMTAQGEHYAKEIATAGNEFAYSIYRHSKLPLKVFEAARITTAIINGCKVCMNWRAARDITLLGIDGGVVSNGEPPSEAFYKDLLDNELDNLDERELLAVRYAREMGTNPKGLSKDESFWKELSAAFTDMEITDLTDCIAGWRGMGRVAHVLGLDGGCSLTTD